MESVSIYVLGNYYDGYGNDYGNNDGFYSNEGSEKASLSQKNYFASAVYEHRIAHVPVSAFSNHLDAGD